MSRYTLHRIDAHFVRSCASTLRSFRHAYQTWGSRVVANVALLLLLPVACDRPLNDAHINKRLMPSLLDQRFTAGRLANQDAWHACTTTEKEEWVVARTDCQETGKRAAAKTRADAKLHQRWHQQLVTMSTPTALRARALFELKSRYDAPPALDRAVALLEEARSIAPDDGAVLNDLAVAYLEQAQRDQDLQLMLKALDVIERVVARDSSLTAARFNRALIRQRMYLIKTAHDGWTQFLAIDNGSDWRNEAQQRQRVLAQQLSDTATWSLDWLETASAEKVRALVRKAPNAAREFYFAKVLAEWGRAVGRSESPRAVRLLELARTIALGFNDMRGDPSIGGALKAIEQAPQQQNQFARAHIELGEGVSFYQRAFYDSAAAPLGTSQVRLRSLRSPAAGWAAYYFAAAHMQISHFDLADSVVSDILSRASQDETALVGKSVWLQGIPQVRRGHHETALRRYQEAVPYIERASEWDNASTLHYLVSEGLILSGKSEEGLREAFRGLKLLSPFRHSNSLTNQLSTVAVRAGDDGLPFSALALMDEAISVASKTGKAEVMAWALRARAGDLMRLDRTTEARTDLLQALEWAGQTPPGRQHDRVQADVNLTLAELKLLDDPHAAMRILANVVDMYRRHELGVFMSSALYTTAMAAQASDSVAAARRYLDQAIQHIEQQGASFASMASRAVLYETVEKVFDGVIELELDARPESAFDYLERSREAARSITEPTAQSSPQHLDRVRAAIPSGMALLEFALLPGRVAVWVVSKDDVKLVRIPVSRDSVAALAGRFRRERNIIENRPTLARAALFDLLIAPLLPHLTGISRLTVVPDRELHSIPFAALWDSKNSQYLLKQFAIHTLPSASFLADAARARVQPPAELRALIVGNPAIDTAAGLDLLPLKAATSEAESIAGLYPKHDLLLEQEAQRKRVLEQLPKHTVFHFAGHAVFNSERPEFSFLAMGSDQPNESGILQAREIGNLGLSNLEIVILAACSTLNPRTTRVGDVAGLANSFLRAGVPSVVSSIWDVDDAVTAQLLYDFHDHYAVHRDAAAALRHAQLKALESGQAERRAIQNWAAFIYTGI